VFPGRWVKPVPDFNQENFMAGLDEQFMANNLRALGIEPEKAVIKLYFAPKTAF
jgi:hypothetical protein